MTDAPRPDLTAAKRRRQAMATLTVVRKRWARVRRRFAVGYLNAGNLIYLSTHNAEPGLSSHGHPIGDPMTRREAEAWLKALPCRGAAVFELVPVAHAKDGR
jgi:hypothetical protein